MSLPYGTEWSSIVSMRRTVVRPTMPLVAIPLAREHLFNNTLLNKQGQRLEHFA